MSSTLSNAFKLELKFTLNILQRQCHMKNVIFTIFLIKNTML